MTAARNAFTLIELLVVVTIIVLLLALLTPALDKSIYQAELTVCGAQIRGVVQGTLTYSVNYKRAYPAPGSAWDPLQLRSTSTWGGSPWNIPALLADYVTPKSFTDPFLKHVNLDWDACMNDSQGVWMPGYRWYPGFGGPACNTVPMRRVGQKLVFTPWAPETDVRNSGVVFADADTRLLVGASVITSTHPDKDGLETLFINRGEGNPWVQNVPLAFGDVWASFWTNGVGQRGPLDDNYGMDDGSVLRVNNVPIMYTLADDSRMTFIPDVGDDTYQATKNDRKQQVPRTP